MEYWMTYCDKLEELHLFAKEDFSREDLEEVGHTIINSCYLTHKQNMEE